MSLLFFGSDRSSRSHKVRAFVRSVQTCLEQSIFIILAQIFKHSVRNKSAVREHSESTQRAIREQSESNQRIKIGVNTVRAFKYCVLFGEKILMICTYF